MRFISLPFSSQIEIFYLHGPDRTTPFEATLRGVNDLYQEGKFKRFGISNFAAYVPELVFGLLDFYSRNFVQVGSC